MDLSSMNVIAPAANIGSAPRMKMTCNGARWLDGRLPDQVRDWPAMVIKV